MADVSELFDPRAIAAGVCGGGAKHATTFKPMQLALVSPAEGAAADPAGPPLWDGLGTLSYPITTNNEMAQRYFDQGLRLAYAFNHPEAQRAFKKAQELDPNCAMCFWGEAFVLGANINAAMERERRAAGVRRHDQRQGARRQRQRARAGADRRACDPLLQPIPRPTRRHLRRRTPTPWPRRMRGTPTIRRSRCCSPMR